MSSTTPPHAPPPHATFVGGYPGRDVARLLGLTAAQIRAYVRDGCVTPRPGPHGEQRFSFQDLVLLRTGKTLMESLPTRKVHRALRRLRDQLPRGRALTGVRITAEGDTIVVRDGAAAWIPESGQALLDFEVAELASEVAPLVRQAADAARSAEGELDAEDWYRLGCDLEPCDAAQARDAYRRALELSLDHVDARVNLGRLLHEAGDARAAEAHYRKALELRPDDVTAAFNWGVALEDLGRRDEAMRAYERALAADPAFPDAYFNLSRLCEQLGRPHDALRHLQTYRSLTRAG